MKKYKRPDAIVIDEVSEGVYAASGACYTTTARIHQKPETGRGDYRIQVDGKHDADHNCDGQVLTISFNQDVTFVSCNANGAQCEGSKTGKTLTISMKYWQNHTDNIGFGDLIVTSDEGLAITFVEISDIGHQK